MSTQLPRGVRNRNPGNIERGTDRWLGASTDQSSDPRFLVFDTDEAGIRALMRVLISYQETHAINTLRGAIDRWAPPFENSTSAYVRHVATLTGFDPDETLDFLDKLVCVEVAKAIVRHENGPPERHGRKEWYDSATYDRAAVMAGFSPETKPLTKSREIAGAVLAAAGVAVGAVVGAPVVEATTLPVTTDDITAVVGVISALAGPSALAYLSPVTTLLGVALTIYGRWDSSRRNLR